MKQLFERSKKRAGNFLRNERGISDAVAVLLFVAMVMAIAAVVGAAVLSKAPSGPTPVAQLHIYSSNGKIIIDHLGGDAINPADMRVIVYNLADGSVVDSPIDAPTIDTDVDPSGVFNAGDKIVIDTTDLTSLSAGQYTVRVIFLPLSKSIAENNVFVS